MESYYIQFIEHNNMIINEQSHTVKKLFQLVYDVQPHHAFAW